MNQVKDQIIASLQFALEQANLADVAHPHDNLNDLHPDCSSSKHLHGDLTNALKHLGVDTEHYFECGEWRML